MGLAAGLLPAPQPWLPPPVDQRTGRQGLVSCIRQHVCTPANLHPPSQLSLETVHTVIEK